ncbi:hypothetical protein CLF_100001 [Clonorchis sinensis]|uniref:Uncharacterized protein n=1 Tax=Clonorchis sinensis TaxID=79923 RepID=G7Y2G1_CLOSI|nr:hypothetical protein CLF_100001 [Clonorchis sinensis]
MLNALQGAEGTISTGQLGDHVRTNTIIVVNSMVGYQASFRFTPLATFLTREPHESLLCTGWNWLPSRHHEEVVQLAENPQVTSSGALDTLAFEIYRRMEFRRYPFTQNQPYGIPLERTQTAILAACDILDTTYTASELLPHCTASNFGILAFGEIGLLLILEIVLSKARSLLLKAHCVLANPDLPE